MAEGLYRIGGWLLNALENLLNKVVKRCGWEGVRIKFGFLDGVNFGHLVATYQSPWTPSWKSLVHVSWSHSQLGAVLGPFLTHHIICYNVVVWKHNYLLCLVGKSDSAQIHLAGSCTVEFRFTLDGNVTWAIYKLVFRVTITIKYLLVEVINSKFCLETYYLHAGVKELYSVQFWPPVYTPACGIPPSIRG